MNFPTLVYRAPGTHFSATGTYDYRGVANANELESAISEGWFLSLPEAISGKHEAEPDPEEDAPPTREELEAKAKDLGITFDGRTTDRILGEKIAAALAEQEQ